MAEGPRAVLAAFIAARVTTSEPRPVVVGLCGAQGSGKSTLSQAVATDLRDKGLRTAVLSLDDIYLPRAERRKLAAAVHPLLATRGPPGTHDLQFGLALFDALRRGRDVKLPWFDKAIDDRAPIDQWTEVTGPLDAIIFEGWCVGAKPQPSSDLLSPVNELERRRDPDRVWRTYVNDALAHGYQDLFGEIDHLVLLAAPGFEIVANWRAQQERGLRTKAAGAHERSSIMSEAGIRQFVQFYERLTSHILREMPLRADLTIYLDERRELIRSRPLAADTR